MPDAIMNKICQPSPSRALIVKLFTRRHGAGFGGILGGGGGIELQDDPRKLPAIVLAGHIPRGIGIFKGCIYGISGG